MRASSRGNAGSALLPTLIAVIVLAGLSGVIFRVSLSHSRETGLAGHELRALYLAEMGVGEAILVIANAVRNSESIPTGHGTHAVPIQAQAGQFFASMQDNGDDTYTVVSTGAVNGSRRSIETVLRFAGSSVFDHAVFAGNTSQDPDYTLKFGGVGAQKDTIVGNVFSAGDIDVGGGATLDGDVLATGTISGIAGTENVTRPLPDIASMDYETNHDVDVAATFAAQGVWKSNTLGGSAYQVPEAEPAHIFRKNPNDRLPEINATAKDDYFLEDPYMPVTDFAAAFNGRAGHTITLSGAPSKPGVDGNNLLYYIDGNLWVHNKPFGRLRFLTQGDGTRITFVVKGNVYFCDDVLLKDEAQDGVAFISIKDSGTADSGNIYFGDPRYGTLDRMYAYMYAENDFIDNNLAADGSKVVELFGNMTAGNHVAIERDFVKPDGTVAHSKLGVRFDDRLSKKSISLPGIPRAVEGIGGLQVVFWREVAEQW